MLTWYQRIPDTSLTAVDAAVDAAQIVSDAILSGQNNSELRRAVRKATETPETDMEAKRQGVLETAMVAKLREVLRSLPKFVVEQKKRRRHHLLVCDSLTPTVSRVRLQ